MKNPMACAAKKSWPLGYFQTVLAHVLYQRLLSIPMYSCGIPTPIVNSRRFCGRLKRLNLNVEKATHDGWQIAWPLKYLDSISFESIFAKNLVAIGELWTLFLCRYQLRRSRKWEQCRERMQNRSDFGTKAGHVTDTYRIFGGDMNYWRACISQHVYWAWDLIMNIQQLANQTPDHQVQAACTSEIYVTTE